MPETTPEYERPTTSTRDRDELRRRLTDWLRRRVPAGTGHVVSDLDAPTATGMSSETLLFEASWEEDGRPRSERCVARLRPDEHAVPVFPTYDLERQYRVMTLVGERSSVPVPRTLWWEPDESALGAPFFVMERVDGVVPPDIMPYVFDSWVTAGSPADRARMQAATVAVVAGIHGVEATPDELAFLELDRPGRTALRRHVADQRAFYDWVVDFDGIRSPLLERAFAWLDDNWPDDEGPAVISWGDARIGNILYRDFEPVAVLDWEMAAPAPRETDLGWLVFLHRFFQDIAERAGLPGLPDFLRAGDVAAEYERLTGHAVRHLRFFEVYAALRHGIVMFRISRRMAAFGETTLPGDPDDMVSHRHLLEAMLDGRYWEAG